VDGRAVAGSAAIIDELERLCPEPALYPADPEARRRALEIQEHFDEQVGPHIRRALFSILIREPAYTAALFASDRSAPARFAYRCVLPLVRPVMVKSMQIVEPQVSESFAATQRAFDWVAQHVGRSGYLVGDRFTVADLAAAALLTPGVDVSHPDLRKPDPKPARIREWLARWADHPGAAWVREVYARHRPARAPLRV
jgi:glutathione S-transferase